MTIIMVKKAAKYRGPCCLLENGVEVDSAVISYQEMRGFIKSCNKCGINIPITSVAWE